MCTITYSYALYCVIYDCDPGNIGGHRKLVLTSVYLLSFYSSVHLNLNLLHFFCLLILFHDYYNIYYREKDIAHTAQGQDNYFYSNSNFSWPIQ
jgi:hypothetical protein